MKAQDSHAERLAACQRSCEYFPVQSGTNEIASGGGLVASKAADTLTTVASKYYCKLRCAFTTIFWGTAPK